MWCRRRPLKEGGCWCRCRPLQLLLPLEAGSTLGRQSDDLSAILYAGERAMQAVERASSASRLQEVCTLKTD